MDILPRLVSVSINMVNISSVFYLTELSKKKKKIISENIRNYYYVNIPGFSPLLKQTPRQMYYNLHNCTNETTFSTSINLTTTV